MGSMGVREAGRRLESYFERPPVYRKKKHLLQTASFCMQSMSVRASRRLVMQW